MGAGQQELWLPGDHGPVQGGHKVARHEEGHRDDVHVLDVEVKVLGVVRLDDVGVKVVHGGREGDVLDDVGHVEDDEEKVGPDEVVAEQGGQLGGAGGAVDGGPPPPHVDDEAAECDVDAGRRKAEAATGTPQARPQGGGGAAVAAGGGRRLVLQLEARGELLDDLAVAEPLSHTSEICRSRRDVSCCVSPPPPKTISISTRFRGAVL